MENLPTGLVLSMSNADYHAQPHFSSSGFKLLQKSPAHYFESSPHNPARPAKEPTIYMVMGTAWHTGIFEPEKFASTYGVKPDISANSTLFAVLQAALSAPDEFATKFAALPEGVSKTTKEGKALIAELAAREVTAVDFETHAKVCEFLPVLRGRVLLSADAMKDVQAMAAAAHAHPVTKTIFAQAGGMAEASIFWRDAETGAPCRMRPDYMIPPCAMFPNGLIIDGKSNDDSSPEAFGRNMFQSEMYFQAAFYSDGFQHYFDTDAPPLFAWMAQERDAPYATAYYAAPSDFIEFGRRKYRRLLAMFARCLDSGQWPAYPQDVGELVLPAWAAKQIDESLK